jgi:hypothetical protein
VSDLIDRCAASLGFNQGRIKLAAAIAAMPASIEKTPTRHAAMNVIKEIDVTYSP